MSYDVLLSQLAEEKLSMFTESDQGRSETDGSCSSGAKTSTKKSTEGLTPTRKVSTSRLMNAFSQFYGNGDDDQSASCSNSSSSCSRTPTRGVESKLMSMWHNVKYGWSGKIKSNFSKEQPVWLLGRCYHRKFTPPSSMESSAEFTLNAENKLIEPGVQMYENLPVQELGMDAIENQNSENPWEEGIDGFRKDFYSRLWMTYRREFPIMNGSNYTSDCGWGCMLRSGQMLLAQGLICHFLGRSRHVMMQQNFPMSSNTLFLGWRWDPDTQIHSTYEDNMHRKIIRWFGDSSSKNSPFSIHALVTLGQEFGKKPGDWYGPSSVSHLLRQAVKKAALENADFDDINVYVAKECTVYIQDILDECLVPERPSGFSVPWQHSSNQTTQKIAQSQMHWKALILLIPLRLGAEKLNPIYAHCLKLLLSTEYCLGIIGGRPKHSLYFVGFQEDKLIHLDPHYCQEMVDVNQENFPVHTFHCKSPRKLKVTRIDPSCCIGFYCQTRADFDNFISTAQPYLHPSRTASQVFDKPLTGSPSSSQENNYPMFVFVEGSSKNHTEIVESVYKPLQQQLCYLRQQLCHNDDDDDDETEEFVIL